MGPCTMTEAQTDKLWIGFLHMHVPDAKLKENVLGFLRKHAAAWVKTTPKIQMASTHFKKAHVFLDPLNPIPREVAYRLNQSEFIEGGTRRTVCVEDMNGSRGNPCRRFVAGYCRGQNLRFTRPCWCKHPQRPTENARYSLKPMDLDGAKGEEIAKKFSASFGGRPRVVGLKKIHNEMLSKCHEEYRKYLSNKHGEEPAVQELYHGTNNNILDILYTHGLQPPSDMKPSDRCPISGGKGLCTSLCTNDCRYCTERHDWGRCHMYGLGIYLADMAEKSHRYTQRAQGKRTYRMVVCSVLGKAFQIEGYLKGNQIMHDVVDVRDLNEDDLDEMIEPCRACKATSGVGAYIESLDGERWGRVVAEEMYCWKLHTGRIARKENEDYKWRWSMDGGETMDTLEMSAEKSDLIYVKGLGDAYRYNYSVINSEYIAFHPHQCLPLYEIEYEI